MRDSELVRAEDWRSCATRQVRGDWTPLNAARGGFKSQAPIPHKEGPLSDVEKRRESKLFSEGSAGEKFGGSERSGSGLLPLCHAVRRLLVLKTEQVGLGRAEEKGGSRRAGRGSEELRSSPESRLRGGELGEPSRKKALSGEGKGTQRPEQQPYSLRGPSRT